MSVVGVQEIKAISVDGLEDPETGIQYWGIATKQPDGTWRCLANVNDHLCVVEVNIKFLEVQKP